jgi:L-aminopeptidase/D-esterase-like protein
VAANPVGEVTIGASGHFWAAPFEENGEFGGLGLPRRWPAAPIGFKLKGEAHASTTLAIVATNARLDKRQCHRLAVMAQSGMARAIRPVHTPLDGDTVFAISAGETGIDPLHGLARLGTAAADCLARAIARGVHAAAPTPSGWTGPPAWVTRFSDNPAGYTS